MTVLRGFDKAILSGEGGNKIFDPPLGLIKKSGLQPSSKFCRVCRGHKGGHNDSFEGV